MKYTEYTVLELAKCLEKTEGDGGISTDSARHRLQRHGYTAKRYIGVNAIYELSKKDIEFLKQCDKRGRRPGKLKTNTADNKPAKKI
jgi:hypothetical protein